MKFEGNLSKFFPPDLLIFLANFGKEGVLTVTFNNEFFSISFKNGGITDAHSSISDDKLLKTLYLYKHITSLHYKQIMQARKETGIDILQIIEKLKIVPFENIEDIIINGIKEVIFRFFLLKNGEFKFSDIHVDTLRLNTPVNPHAVALEISSKIDEWQEIERKFTTLDRLAILTDTGRQADKITAEEKILFRLIQNGKTISELVNLSPMRSHTALKAIEQAVDKKMLMLQQQEKKAVVDETLSETDKSFYGFKGALKKIITAKNNAEKINGLIGFCKDNFDMTFVMSTTRTTLVRCFVFFKDQNNNLKSKEVRNIEYNIDDEPVFSRAYSSGYPFFGRIFTVELISKIIKLPATGECAVIPLGKKDDRMNFIFTVSEKTTAGTGPFNYLELLSWFTCPGVESNAIPEPSEQIHSGDRKQVSDLTDIEQKKKALDEIIDVLPPMPHLASKMLQILSDPDSSVEDLTNVLVQDQAMMATLIKVSNSVLYRTGEEISTLNNAVTRLGFKTIRSLVLTATTHSVFPKNNAKLEVMSQNLWQHSKECGLASRRTAEAIGYNDPEEAFVAGLLHDIGKLTILLKFTDSYNSIVKAQKSDAIPSVKTEKEILGFDHSEAGGMLMEKWKIPGNLSACVKFHHNPEGAGEFTMLANIVAVGDSLSHLYGANSHDLQPGESDTASPAIKALELPPEEIFSLVEQVTDDFNHSDVFD